MVEERRVEELGEEKVVMAEDNQEEEEVGQEDSQEEAEEAMAEDNQEEEVGQEEEEEVEQEVGQEVEEEDTGRCAKASGPFGWPKDDDQSLRT